MPMFFFARITKCSPGSTRTFHDTSFIWPYKATGIIFREKVNETAELPGPNRDWEEQTPDDPDEQTDNDFGSRNLHLKKIDNCYLKICML